jgi:long-chain acyl-CoA synthetase
MSAFFLTGGTGFVGTYVARWLIGNTDRPVIALVRAVDDGAAKRRLARAWWDHPELIAELETRIEVVAGDVCHERLGLDEQRYDELVKRIGSIVHSAADIRLTAPLDELRRTNVDGTRNVLKLANDMHRDHGLSRLSHVSTAYVAGRRQGPVPEGDLGDEVGRERGGRGRWLVSGTRGAFAGGARIVYDIGGGRDQCPASAGQQRLLPLRGAGDSGARFGGADCESVGVS